MTVQLDSFSIWSQYPLRRASSWRFCGGRGTVSCLKCLNTLSGGHPLGGNGNSYSNRYCYSGLNTLSGGHPLGGRYAEIMDYDFLASQYPLRRASSWRIILRGIPSDGGDASQYPLRRASSWRSPGKCRSRWRRSSQYPLRRASSWRFTNVGVVKGNLVSQYPLRRASSWRFGGCKAKEATYSRLNTLSGGHPLGGVALGYLAMFWNESQYPLRRASSWRTSPSSGPVPTSPVSIPSQAGILLAGKADAIGLSSNVVSIPSQAGILLAGETLVPDSVPPARSQYPLRRASSWRGRPRCSAHGAKCLNTLSGGHPLGGDGWQAAYTAASQRLNTLSGGHPLGGFPR